MAEIPPHPAEPGRLDRRTLVSAAAWAVPVIAMAAAAPSAAASDPATPPGWGGEGSTEVKITDGTWVSVTPVYFQMSTAPYAQFYVNHYWGEQAHTVYYGYMLKQTATQQVQNSSTRSAVMPARQYMQVEVNEIITGPPSSMVIVANTEYQLQAWARVTDPTTLQTELVLSVPIARTFTNSYNV